jgi:hypothetical protein
MLKAGKMPRRDFVGVLSGKRTVPFRLPPVPEVAAK